jgi:hypothetical protein
MHRIVSSCTTPLQSRNPTSRIDVVNIKRDEYCDTIGMAVFGHWLMYTSKTRSRIHFVDVSGLSTDSSDGLVVSPVIHPPVGSDRALSGRLNDPTDLAVVGDRLWILDGGLLLFALGSNKKDPAAPPELTPLTFSSLSHRFSRRIRAVPCAEGGVRLFVSGVPDSHVPSHVVTCLVGDGTSARVSDSKSLPKEELDWRVVSENKAEVMAAARGRVVMAVARVSSVLLLDAGDTRILRTLRNPPRNDSGSARMVVVGDALVIAHGGVLELRSDFMDF